MPHRNDKKPNPAIRTPDVIWIGTLDMGSNNFRASVHEVDTKSRLVKHPMPKDMTARTCALAEGMSPHNSRIKENNLKDGERALARFAQYFKELNIPPENVIAVATAAVRQAQTIPQGKMDIHRLRAAFRPYSFKIISGEAESRLVGASVINDPLFPYSAWKQDKILYVSIGGGSIETGTIITRTGEIEDPRAHPYGIHPLHTLLRENPNDKTIIDRTLKQIFKEANIQSCSTVCALGGIWRVLGGIVCDKDHHILTDKDIINDALTAAANTPIEVYRNHANKKINARAEDIALSARTLNIFTQFVDAEKLVFIDTKMVDTLALLLHKQHTEFPTVQGISTKSPSLGLT